MKRSILAAAIASSLAQPAFAEVPKNVHELCLSAADYSGCVKINSGDLGNFRSDGNACPKGYAYVGNKTCREVECRYLTYRAPHSALLAGKAWKCKSKALTIMKLTPGVSVRMIYDSKCPEGKPEIGWNSTCDYPYIEPPKKDRIEGRRREMEG